MRTFAAIFLAACGSTITSTPRASVDHVAYPDGSRRFEFELHDGFPNGRGRSWYPNGNLASEGMYRDGARHGLFRVYNEDGTFAAQVLYIDNAEVWRSTSPDAPMPDQWNGQVAFQPIAEEPAPIAATIDPTVPWNARPKAPRPYFSMLDRTTAPARAGVQIGMSTAKELGFGAATRVDMFGHYRLGRYGLFAQLSETHLDVADGMTLAGRRGAIVGGTYHHSLGIVSLSANAGALMPLANTDVTGSVASYAGAQQRPADAALAVPAAFGVRSGASVAASHGPLVLQADAGVDWMVGSDERAIDPLARANVGVGFGTRSSILTAELANVFRLAGDHPDLHAVALGGTLALPAVWISADLVFSFDDTISFVGTIGRDL